MAKKENKEQEQEEELFGCTVVLTSTCVLSFSGDKKKISERLKFIFFSIMFSEEKGSFDEDGENFELKFVPVIIVAEEDVSDVKCFSLRNYLPEMERWK